MHTDSTALKFLLLDLLAPQRTVTPEHVQTLETEQWTQLLTLARQHRLEPWLYWQFQHERKALPIPEWVRNHCQQAFKKSAQRSLGLQRVLLQIHQQFSTAGIEYIALKGAYLAFHTYPHPALRPMRDLDILVRKEDALRAYQLLLESGFTPVTGYGYEGKIEAILEVNKHLPPLRSPNKETTIEIHTRLSEHEYGTRDLSVLPSFWANRQWAFLGKTQLAFEGKHELLLHLIVHAVQGHQFNNGPLLLSDLALLLKKEPTIQWAQFWASAAQQQQTRNCVLALKLLEKYWGALGIEWPSSLPTEQPPVEQACMLMLITAEERVHQRITKHQHIGYELRHLINRAFLAPKEMAAFYSVPSNSWKIYFYYPRRWWWFLSKRFPELLAARKHAQFANNAQNIHALQRWVSPK